MITRVWRGWTPADRAHEYERHYRSEGLPVLRGVWRDRGRVSAGRTTGDETEFVSLTFFDDLDAVRSFAGADYETAVVAGEAREVLVRFDERVGHYETAVDA